MVGKYAHVERVLRIVFGIAMLVFLMTGGASAQDNGNPYKMNYESNSIASTVESEWTSKPVVVNLQVDLDDEQDVRFFYPVLNEIEKRNWIVTVYVSGKIAEKYPEVVRNIDDKGHYIGVSGYAKGENLSELSYDEQLKLINKSIYLVKSIVNYPSNVVDFKSQTLEYNNDAIQILQSQEIKSITGVFNSNESFCKCWFAKSIGRITFPYPITNDFVAVPISTVEINSKQILLKDDVFFNSSSSANNDYLGYLIKAYEEHNISKDPMVIEVNPSITGSDAGKLEILARFLDYITANGGVIKPTAPITILGGYISVLDASGPESAFPTELITLRVNYTSTLYCPIYYFRAYGKYPNGGWTYLGQTSYYVMTGPHSFSMQVEVPKPPKDANKLTIRVVGRACKDVCWPDVDNYEVMDELLVNIKTDLNISSPDLIISPIPHKISAKVYNKGDALVENVEVKFIDKVGNKEARSEVKTIAKINAREFGTASSDWIIDLGHDYEVIVDPLNKIKESDENNNRAETHKIKGTVKDSSGNLLNKTRFDYLELDGANWQKKFTGFTDESGRYNITVNLDVISNGKRGKVNATLEFSPTQKIADIRFRVFDDSEWGAGGSPRAGANPIAKDTAEWVMDKSRDYNGDIAFNPHNGTIAYRTLIQSYGYFKGLNIAREQLIQIEVNNHDVAACNDTTSCWIPANNVITFWHIRSNQPSTIAHEYSHAVSSPWNTPYDPIDENWANYGSVISRGTNIYNFWGTLVDIFDDDYTDGSPPPAVANGTWNFQLAGTYSKLSRDHVITTMRRDGPRDGALPNRTEYAKSFYLSYRTHDNARTSSSIKRVFRNHGFRTAGWPGSPSPENSSFSNIYKHYKVDENGDSVAESLNIDVGVNISVQGNYTIYGYLVDSSGSGYYSYAKNITWLNAGLGNVTLSFTGSSIYQNRLNGSYSLVDSYLMYNDTQIDYRETAYITSAYNYTEFFRPAVIPTGNFGDKGVDINGDGLFDYLELGILLNASAAGNYSIRGSLYDSASNKIQDSFGIKYLTAGLNWMNLTIEGATIYANGRNGSYVLRGLYITGEQEAPVYSDDRALYSTSVYNITSFKAPGARFTGVISDSGTDRDSDSFFDYLTLNVSIESNSPANFTLNGYLYNGSEFITSGYNATFINTGRQSIRLDIDGRAIRQNKVNNSYNMALELSDINGTLIGKTSYVTSFYNYTQFQPPESEYFNISYTDRGIDTNGDLLYDNLTINLSISTIVPGNYSIQGYLYNRNGSFVAYADNNVNLTANVKTVQLNFDGKELWKTRIINGSYNLTLKIYGFNYTHAVDLKDAYTTSIYNYTQFQKPKGAFDLFFYGYGRDLDGNGLYDYLTIDTIVNVTSSGNYSISGLLVDANGSEIVWASNLSYLGAGNRTVSLDFDGMRIYEHRINGTYTLRSLSLNDANGSTIDFIDNAFVTQQYNYTQFQIGGTIRGWVKDSNGAPVFDAFVKASGISNSSVNTDINGSYSIPGLKTGSYLVSVSPPSGSNLTGSSSGVYVTAGNAYVVNFTLQKGARILGTVTDSNGTSVPNALVQLSGAAYASTNTGMNGSYAFEGLNAGSYTVDVIPQPTINLMDNSTPITLTVNQTMQLNFTLLPAGSIGGIVTDKNGTPMPDVILYLSGYETPRFRTDANGSYIIPRLGAGTYTVNIDATERGFFENSSSVTVILGMTSIVNFTLQKGGLIIGNVTTSNGTAVANAYVYVYSGPTYRSGYTSAEGRYTFGAMLAGNYTIRADPPYGNELVGNSTDVMVALEQNVTANIILPRGGFISGNVTTSNGTPVVNSHVYVYWGPTYKSTYTGTDGSYSLIGLLAGNYTIYAESPYGSELVGNSTNVIVALGQNVTANIILPLGGVITGNITTSNGTAVANSNVYVYSGPTYKNVYTDANGSYSLIGLLAGNYTIRAEPPYGSELAGNSTTAVIAALGQNVTANIILPRGGVIRGNVTTSNGTAVANAYVYVSSGPTYKSSYTDANGSYALIGLSNGTYIIVIFGSNQWWIVQDNVYTVYGNSISFYQNLEQTTILDFTQISPPGINNVTITPRYPGNNVSVVIQANISSTYGVNSAYLVYSLDGMNWTSVQMNNISSNYTAVIPAPNLTTTVSYYISVKDLMMRLRNSSLLSYIADGMPPVFGDIEINPSYPDNSQPVEVKAEIWDNVGINTSMMWYTYDNIEWNSTLLYRSSLSYPNETISGSGNTTLICNYLFWDTYNGGYIIDGGDDAYDSIYYLNYGGNTYTGASYQWEAFGREIVFQQQNINGMNVSRKFYAPQQGYWGRYIDTIYNPTDNDIEALIQVYGNLGSDSSTYTWADEGQWLGTDDYDASGDPSLSHVFGKHNANAIRSADNIYINYRLNIPANEARSVITFAVKAPNQSFARNISEDILKTFENESSEYNAFMSEEEISRVVNWDMGGPFKGVIPPANKITDVHFYIYATDLSGNSANSTLYALQGTIVGTITYSNNGTVIPGVVVNLTNASGVVASTATNASGNFNFTNVIPGNYNVNVSQPHFFGNSTSVAVAAGSTNSVNLFLSLKGDLNNDGQVAKAVDVNMMIQASVGDIIADLRYDLNGDGTPANAVDVNMMIQASVGDIIL